VLFHVCACEVDACSRAEEPLDPAVCGSESNLHGHGSHACADEGAGGHEDGACGHEDDACGHEESCSTDPCQDMVRSLSSRADLESQMTAPLCLPTPAFLDDLPPCSQGVPFPATVEDRAVDRPLAERFRPLLN
jgi:hypothetical protein